MPKAFDPCALVPAFDAEATVGAVVRGLRQSVARVLVVDDGSSDGTAEAAAAAGAEVLRRPANGGKGAAMRAGLERLLASDATHVAFVDADGQHDPADLPALLAAARAGDDFVIGSRMAEPDAIPRYRYRTNEIGSRILSRMTGLEVEDAQSGYRVVVRGPAAQARAERARIHHRDRDPAEGRAAPEAVPPRARARDLRRALALPAVSRHLDHLVGGGVLQGVRAGLIEGRDARSGGSTPPDGS